MKFDNEKYKQEWKKLNMKQIKATYKSDFVEEFKRACVTLEISQSEVIKKAMMETIKKSQIY